MQESVAELVANAMQAKNASQLAKAVREAGGWRYSQFQDLPSFDIVAGTTIDVMHAIYEGVVKTVIATYKEEGTLLRRYRCYIYIYMCVWIYISSVVMCLLVFLISFSICFCCVYLI